MREGYAVQVLKMGETILTIETRMLAGADLSDDDCAAIRDAGAMLLAFVGPEEKCMHCGGVKSDHVANYYCSLFEKAD